MSKILFCVFLVAFSVAFSQGNAVYEKKALGLKISFLEEFLDESFDEQTDKQSVEQVDKLLQKTISQIIETEDENGLQLLTDLNSTLKKLEKQEQKRIAKEMQYKLSQESEMAQEQEVIEKNKLKDDDDNIAVANKKGLLGLLYSKETLNEKSDRELELKKMEVEKLKLEKEKLEQEWQKLQLDEEKRKKMAKSAKLGNCTNSVTNTAKSGNWLEGILNGFSAAANCADAFDED